MRLLKNVLWNIKDNKPNRISIEEDGSFEITYNYRDNWGEGFTYDTYFGEKHEQSEWFRPLTIDEQVDYLYNLCLNGKSAKEYREILDFVSYFAFAEVEHLNSALAHLDFAPEDIDHQDYIKSHIRKALNTQANEQALNQQEK